MRYTEKRRQFTREINFVKQAMFFATAAAFAAGASDMAGNAVAGGLGNFGILLILVRVYFMAPVVIASVRAQDSQWAAEERRNSCGVLLGFIWWDARAGGFFLRASRCSFFWAWLDKRVVFRDNSLLPGSNGYALQHVPRGKKNAKVLLFVSIGGVRSEET